MKVRVWAVAMLAIAVLLGSSAYLAREQWRYEMEAAQKSAEIRVARLAALLADALRASLDADLPALVESEGSADPRLVRIRLQTDDGRVLADFERPPASAPLFTNACSFSYGNHERVTLTVTSQSSAALTHSRRFASRLALADLVIAASIAAISVLFISNRQAVRRYRILLATNQALLNGVDRPDLLNAICSAAVSEGGFALVWIALTVKDGFLRSEAVAGSALGYVEGLSLSARPDEPEGQGPAGVALREARDVISNDFRRDPLTVRWAERARRFGIRASAALPLSRDGQPIGIIGLYSTERGHFDAVECTLVRHLAEDISLGLEHLRRGAEIERNSAQLRMILDGLPTFVSLISVDGNVLEINQAPLEAADLTREQVIGTALADTYPFSYSAAAADRVRSALMTAVRGESVRYDEVIRVAGDMRVTVDLTFSPLRDQEGRIDRILASAVDITRRKKAQQDLQAYAERLRGLSRRLMEVEESERRNITRELHDRVGQGLAALNLNLGLIRSGVGKEHQGSALGERLTTAQTLLESAIADIRDLMADLQPPALDDYGLFAALTVYVDSLRRTTAVPVTLTGQDLEPPLSPVVAMALFRIAQGALTNAVKHAAAGSITVDLAASADSVILTVADDGRGWEINAERSSAPSWGLSIMRERAEAVGAMLAIQSTPGKGTRVVVELPRGHA